MSRLCRQALSLSGVALITGAVHRDCRGTFQETWQADDWRELGFSSPFFQENLVHSMAPWTLRGLHWQCGNAAQGKLIRCVAGSLLDVVVDLRSDSPTFGHHLKVALSANDNTALWVPKGFAHGYVTTAPNTLVLYKVDAPWCPTAERACRWDSPQLHIDWAIPDGVTLTMAQKDEMAPEWTPLMTESD